MKYDKFQIIRLSVDDAHVPVVHGTLVSVARQNGPDEWEAVIHGRANIEVEPGGHRLDVDLIRIAESTIQGTDETTDDRSAIGSATAEPTTEAALEVTTHALDGMWVRTVDSTVVFRGIGTITQAVD